MKTYSEIKKLFEKHCKKNKSIGFYIKTKITGTEHVEVFYIARYLDRESKPKESFYIFDTVNVHGTIVDTFQCGSAYELFKNGADLLEIINEADVIEFFEGIDRRKEYIRKQAIIEHIQGYDFSYYSEEELLRIAKEMELTPYDDDLELDSNLDFKTSWDEYLEIISNKKK